jgi:GTP cyclohydrolase I
MKRKAQTYGSNAMQDVQKEKANHPMPIDRVGVRRIKVPLVVRDRSEGRQHTVAAVELGVDLPSDFKGTHMSRFLEALEHWGEELSYKSLKRLLEDIRQRLEAKKAQAIFDFPYFLRKTSPVSGACGIQGYDCRLTGELGESGGPSFLLEVCVPVMTVCPCSKAISKEGAHSQRSDVHIQVRLKGFNWLEEFIEMAEFEASSPIYSILKREDEKYVTEHAFAAPRFVEDVARGVANRLENHPQVAWFRVEVESHESIHAHNAFAWIERTVLSK